MTTIDRTRPALAPGGRRLALLLAPLVRRLAVFLASRYAARRVSRLPLPRFAERLARRGAVSVSSKLTGFLFDRRLVRRLAWRYATRMIRPRAHRAFSRAIRLFVVLSPLYATPGLAQTASLVVEPLGFAVYPIPTRGVEAAYHLAPESAVSLSYARGATDQLLTAYTASLLLVRYKHLIGSLSHLNLGAGLRTFAQEREVATTVGSGTATASQTAFVAEASFGSQIGFGPIQLACDWIGVAFPLATGASSSDYPDGVDAADEADAEDSFDALTRKPTLEFMRLSVGVAL